MADSHIAEVKRRVSYLLSDEGVRMIRSFYPSSIESQVNYFEVNKEVLKANNHDYFPGWYMGEKPAPPAPIMRKERAHFICSDDVTIAVHLRGILDTPAIVRIHQSVLASSQFFTAKSKPEWSRGEATVDLKHISESVFILYANWAYSGKIVHNGKTLAMAPVNDAALKDHWQILAEAAALGEELIDTGFKHSVLDTMTFVAGITHKAGGKVAQKLMCHAQPVQTIYDGTPEGSGARNLIVDIFARNKEFLEVCGEELPNVFLRDLALKALKSGDKTKSGLAESPCWYHQHAEGEACSSTTARDWKAEFGDNI